MLYCARKAGVTHVLKAGGAQAVAAMAWGTESCPKVSGIRRSGCRVRVGVRVGLSMKGKAAEPNCGGHTCINVLA